MDTTHHTHATKRPMLAPHQDDMRRHVRRRRQRCRDLARHGEVPPTGGIPLDIPAGLPLADVPRDPEAENYYTTSSADLDYEIWGDQAVVSWPRGSHIPVVTTRRQ